MKRNLVYYGASVIIMTVFSFIGGCGLQRAILYQPESFSLGDLHRHAALSGLRLWPAEDSSYLGLTGMKEPVSPRGTVVVFHGNAGAAIHRSYYEAALEARGFRVIIAEYPGYGARTGKKSEEHFVRDARQLVARANSDFGGPIYLWGESLGCAIVAAIAADSALNPSGVALITPWDTLYNLARAKLPIIPVGIFMKDRYDNVAGLVTYAGPVAVLMAERDEIIPARLTRRLYDALPEPKILRVFEGAGHNTWPADPSYSWWDEVVAYLEGKAVKESTAEERLP